MPPVPTNAAAVDPEEILFAIQVGQAAAMHQMPSTNPEEFSVGTIHDDGGVGKMRLCDNSMNRFSLAVREHCKNDVEEFKSIMTRWFALLHILSDPRLVQLTRSSNQDDADEMRTEVITIAATMSLDRDGRFKPNKFFRRVQALIAESQAA
ncbi:MAG: hypothetical protein AAF709_06545 [Pseudomonadota bacterium]